MSLKDAAFGAQVAAFPNTGFMGLPLLVTLVGPAAAGTMISTIVVDIVLTSSVCIALAQWQEASKTGTAPLSLWHCAARRQIRCLGPSRLGPQARLPV